VRASIATTFEAPLLEQIGPLNETPYGQTVMKSSTGRAGDWFRDLGDGTAI